MHGYELDATDLTIVRALRNDGRASYAGIGQAIGLSGDAVRARVNRLVATDALRIVGVVHPRSLGYDVLGTAWLSVPTDVAAFADALRSNAHVTYFVECLGTPNALVEIAGADDADVAATISGILREFPAVHLKEFGRAVAIRKWQSQGRPDTTPLFPPAAAESATPSPLDAALLRVLVSDPRTSYRELAAHTGEPYWSVRRRAKRLFDDGIIRATAVTDPASAGTHIAGALLMSVSGASDRALRDVARMPEVRILVWQVGPFNALAEFQCTSGARFADFTTAVASLDGISRMEARIFVRTHIAPIPWLLEGSVVA